MRKALSLLLAGIMLLALMAACSPGEELATLPEVGNNSPAVNNPGGSEDPTPAVPSPPVASAIDHDPELEFVDGSWRFLEKRQLTVEVFERNAIARTDAHNNIYTDWIKAEVLKNHNVEVTEYISMPRHEEAATIPLWLFAGDCPDICITYAFEAIQEYANMGGVHELSPYIDGYREYLPNMWDLLGETLLYNARNPETGEIYWIDTLKDESARMNTFVRGDWLTKLGLAIPDSRQAFEDMLVAFRDNAELLLGDQASQMIPFSMGKDAGWRTENIAMSFMPEMSNQELYIYGYDTRHILYPNYKEAVRLLNKWYNEKLIWQDFSLYTGQDSPEDDNMKSGYVGAICHNWDYPFRTGSDINTTLERVIGPDAGFIAVDPFKNDAGKYMKLNSNTVDRKFFLPMTNTEPKASMFYFDFLCRPDTIEFMQLGFEGINYDMVDGVPIVKPVVTVEKIDGEDVITSDTELLPYIINSPYNLDLLICINAPYQRGKRTAGVVATGYAGIAADVVLEAIRCAVSDAIIPPTYNFGEIKSESGMGKVLEEKRDTLLNTAINAPVADFDKVFDDGWKEYLGAGGQAIIDERLEKWDFFMGG